MRHPRLPVTQHGATLHPLPSAARHSGKAHFPIKSNKSRLNQEGRSARRNAQPAGRDRKGGPRDRVGLGAPGVSDTGGDGEGGEREPASGVPHLPSSWSGFAQVLPVPCTKWRLSTPLCPLCQQDSWCLWEGHRALANGLCTCCGPALQIPFPGPPPGPPALRPVPGQCCLPGSPGVPTPPGLEQKVPTVRAGQQLAGAPS